MKNSLDSLHSSSLVATKVVPKSRDESNSSVLRRKSAESMNFMRKTSLETLAKIRMSEPENK